MIGQSTECCVEYKNAMQRKELKFLLLFLMVMVFSVAIFSWIGHAATIFSIFKHPTPVSKAFVNSLNMEMLAIPSGSYWRGSENSVDSLFYDERPVHYVRVTKPFYMSATPVTNEQYEQFDPEHQKFRGKWGFSKGDNEAVLFVSWHDAVAFTEWLSEKEGKSYRLPTEAEWEYAARAGSGSDFFTGDVLPEVFYRHQHDGYRPVSVDLSVGQTPPNSWGLMDVHGLVEEWTYDWYGPYVQGPLIDPVGYEDGYVKVTRGGSHNTDVKYLRSANRFGAIPENRNFLIGFRVVCGEMPESKPLPLPEAPLWAKGVEQKVVNNTTPNNRPEPVFKKPISYVNMPDSVPYITFMTHHPAITVLANGDLMAVWHAHNHEVSRQLRVVGARLRAGSDDWEMASEFFRVPGRNVHAMELFTDTDGTVYHFNGLSTGAAVHHVLAIIMRKSTDHGATWSKPEIIFPEHQSRHQVRDGAFKTRSGIFVLPADANPGGATIHISRDGGQSWEDPGGRIRGIHAGIVELKDGRIMAIGRSEDIEGRSPVSITADMGKTWKYEASPFPPIRGGQRNVLMRLKEGPILFISFTDLRNAPRKNGMIFTNQEGQHFKGYGLFAALSYDEGKTWPLRKLLTPGDGQIYYSRHRHNGPDDPFVASFDNAENQGYMSATQAPDGIIHLLSSRLHYRFNLEWLEQGKN